VQECVIGIILTQEVDGKEFPIASLSRRHIDVETRYAFVEKTCLSLYYACSKLRSYMLTSSCIVVCQHDVIKCKLQKPIFSGRLGKWAFSLVEHDLRFEPLKARRGQVVTYFIVDHGVEMDNVVCLIDEEGWKLFFDGSVCSQGRGVGCLIVSPSGSEHEISVRLEFDCTNNQAEYEALLIVLGLLVDIGAKNMEIFGD
jgi:hypothetical protein